MIALIIGSDWSIKASEAIALKYKVSPFVIGASLVAFGTSLPELAASISATTKSLGDIAVANVIGSTIFNIALVLGVVFFIAKNIKTKRDIFKKDSLFMILPILLFLTLGFDGSLDAIDGIALLSMMVAFIMFLVYDHVDLSEEVDQKDGLMPWSKIILLLIVGFSFIIIGANYAIESVSSIALSLGVSNWVVGIFLVAFGTSLPELVVSISATLKGKADMAIGAIIGSNVSNFSLVLGVPAIMNGLNINFEKAGFDIFMATILSILLIFITLNKAYTKSTSIILFSFIMVLLAKQF
jgi:cation:H+ antiporter